jgi:hypothetical protein
MLSLTPRRRITAPSKSTTSSPRPRRSGLVLAALAAVAMALTAGPVGTASADTFSSTAGQYPQAPWHPYSATSPFNRRLPANPRVSANSSTYMQRIKAFSPTLDNNIVGQQSSQDFNHPTYYSSATDPLVKIHCTEPWGTCAVEGMQIRIPSAAKPTTSSDAHMTVVDPASGWEYDFWETSSTRSAQLNIGWGGRTRIDGDGLNSDGTAAKFGNLAGIIRAPEMQAMTDIGHALFMVIACDDGTHVYPATKSGHKCAGGIPMGSQVWLQMSDTEIDALAVPAWQKVLLRAFAHYGAFFGDTGGPGWQLQFESGLTYTSFGRPDPLVAWAKSQGWAAWNGTYVGKWSLPSSVLTRFHVLDPCVSKGTC